MSKGEYRLWSMLVNMLPKKLLYMCAIRVAAEATTGKYSQTIVPELTAIEAASRYHDMHNLNYDLFNFKNCIRYMTSIEYRLKK